MPNNVIDQIHALAKNEGAEDFDNDGCPIFEWKLGTPVRELEDDKNLDDSHDGDTGHDDNDDENTDDNNDSVVDGNISDEDEDDIMDDAKESDDGSLSDPAEVTESLDEDSSVSESSQEFRSGNSELKPRSKDSTIVLTVMILTKNLRRWTWEAM